MRKIKTVCEAAKEYFKLKHLKSDIVVDNQGRMVACPDHKKVVRLNPDGAIEVFQPPGRAEFKPIDGIKYVPLMVENQVCLFRDFSKDNFILVLDENMQERGRFHTDPDKDLFDDPVVYKDMIIFRHYIKGKKLINVELSRNRDIFYSWDEDYLRGYSISKLQTGLVWESTSSMGLLAMDIRGNTLWEYTPDYGDMKSIHHLIGNGNILVGVYIAGLLEEFHVLDYTGKVVNVIVPPKYFPGQHFMETEIFKDEQGNTCIYFYHGHLSDEHGDAFYVITLNPDGQECLRAGREKHIIPRGYMHGEKLFVYLPVPYNEQMGIFNIKEDSIKIIPWKEEDLHCEIISNNEGVFASSGRDLCKLNSDWGKEWEIHVGSYIYDYKVRGDYIYISSDDKFGIYKVL